MLFLARPDVNTRIPYPVMLSKVVIDPCLAWFSVRQSNQDAGMTLELFAVLGVGIALAGLILNDLRNVTARMDR